MLARDKKCLLQSSGEKKVPEALCCLYLDLPVAAFMAFHRDAVSLLVSTSFSKYSFFAAVTSLLTLFLRILYSAVSFCFLHLSHYFIVCIISGVSHFGKTLCFTLFLRIGACLSNTGRKLLYQVLSASSGSVF